MRLRKILGSVSAIVAFMFSQAGFAKDAVDFDWSGRIATDFNFHAIKPKGSSLTHGAALRAAELSLGVDFNNSISLNLDLGFSPEGVEIGTAFVRFEDLFYNTDLFIGQVPTPFCQEASSSSKTLPFHEKSLATAFKACIGPGIFLNHHQDLWAVQFGVRSAPFGHKVNDPDGGKKEYFEHFNDHFGGALRVSGAPVMNDDMVLHLGASGTYQMMAAPQGGFMNYTKFKATEVSGRNVKDEMEFSSGDIDAKSFAVVGFEVSPTYGPVQLESETVVNFVTMRDSAKKNEMFWATQAGLNWTITGQKRKYSVSRGIFEGIERKNVGAFGVWQLAARYSHLDLSSKNDNMKKYANNVTGALNWLPTEELRFGINYVHSMQKQGDEDQKNFGTMSLRMQVTF